MLVGTVLHVEFYVIAIETKDSRSSIAGLRMEPGIIPLRGSLLTISTNSYAFIPSKY